MQILELFSGIKEILNIKFGRGRINLLISRKDSNIHVIEVPIKMVMGRILPTIDVFGKYTIRRVLKEQ